MNKIPNAFLSHASSVLTSTEHGLSGSKIVEFCNAWATDYGVDTPHAIYPFNARNKRTALLENLLAFSPEVQYQMLLDLFDLAGAERSEVQSLRTKLLGHFQSSLGRPSSSPGHREPSVLEFFGVADAGSYSNIQAASLSQPLSVFICHASEDKAAARRLYTQLRTDGFSPWLDEEDLIPGQDWAAEIPRAVRKSDVVLVCLSRRSVEKTGYVQKEIRIALDAAEERPDGVTYIIPARLEECRVPERLAKWQRVDTFSPKGYERLCRALNAPRGAK